MSLDQSAKHAARGLVSLFLDASSEREELGCRRKCTCVGTLILVYAVKFYKSALAWPLDADRRCIGMSRKKCNPHIGSDFEEFLKKSTNSTMPPRSQ
jgi:hypothetical protein